MIRNSNQFEIRTIVRAEPTPAREMWIAVWSNRGRGHVMLGAPTLDLLADRWEQITSSDFNRTIAQRVILMAWHKSDAGAAPEPVPTPPAVDHTGSESAQSAPDSEERAEAISP